jgi:hypothetical protein
LIRDALTAVSAQAEPKSSAATIARKVARALRDLETYVSAQSDRIIDYATTRRRVASIWTAPTEGLVQWLWHRRIAVRQWMRWSPCGAQLMLKVRTSVMNGTFASDHALAKRWARRPLRHAA